MKSQKSLSASLNSEMTAATPGYWRSLFMLGLVALIFVTCDVKAVRSELIVSAIDTQYQINFDQTVAGVNQGQWMGSGLSFDPGNGQLDSDAWIFDGFSSADDLSRGTSQGGVSSGGLYAFDITGGSSSADMMLGWQPTGSDFTPGFVTLNVRNSAGAEMSNWSIGYDAWQFNNGDRSSSLQFAYAVGGGDFVEVTSFDFATDLAAADSPTWLQQAFGESLEIIVPDGELLRLRWMTDDVDGSGSRDEFGIDNILITAAPTAAVPEPSSVALFLGGALSIGCVHFRRQLKKRKRLGIQ